MRQITSTGIMLAAVSLFGITAHPAKAADRLVTPEEGMVFSAHSPAIGDCGAINWYFRIGPDYTVTGMIYHLGTEDVWRAKGTYTPEHTFHLDTRELNGPGRTGSVDGEVMQNGSLVMKIGDVSGPSPCADKTIYLPWFRDGNAYDPNSGAGGG
jgi:hypothetical protein